MDDNLNNKIEKKENLFLFFKRNKAKLIYSFIFLILIIILIFFYKINNAKKNELVSEKYIEAGLLLASNEFEKSKVLYEEIILSKNKFYSTLALQSLLERNMLKDNDKVLKYFELLDEIKKPKRQQDLLNLKKALFLLKISKIEEGNRLLQNLINSDSELKNIAKDLIKKNNN